MLEELLKSSNLGSRDEISFVLFNALSPSSSKSLEDIRKFSISSIFSIRQSFDGIISLLKLLSIIEVADQQVSLNSDIFDRSKYSDSKSYFDNGALIELFIKKISECDREEYIFTKDNLKYNSKEKFYYVRLHLIRFEFLIIKNLLLSIGFFSIDYDHNNHLIIDNKYKDLVKEIIIKKINSSDEIQTMTLA